MAKNIHKNKHFFKRIPKTAQVISIFAPNNHLCTAISFNLFNNELNRRGIYVFFLPKLKKNFENIKYVSTLASIKKT